MAPAARRRGRLLGSAPVAWACRAIGVGLLALVIVAGYAGEATALDNFAPTFILIVFWVGLVFASALFGDLFAAFSPWRAFRFRGVREYPERLGRYPAALGLLAFTWVELVSGWGETPSSLTTAAVVYTVYTLAMQYPLRRRRRGRAAGRRSPSTSACSRASARSRPATAWWAGVRRSAGCRRWTRSRARCSSSA